jgi:foldase protein PrsA
MPRHQRPIRSALLACAIGVPTAAVLAGCGGLSADAVAKVDGTEISKSQFEQARQLQLISASQQVMSGKLFDTANPRIVSFKAPYTECTTLVKKNLPKEQAKQVQDAQIKQYCQSIDKQSKDAAMQSLLTQKVVAGEADQSKLTASDAEINKQLDTIYTQLIGGKKNLAKFTKLAGGNADSLRAEAKNAVLLEKLQKKIQKDAGTVTDADVLAYYNKNKAQYAQPETRNLHVVLTKTEGDANKAKKALEGGQSFATVAKKYSIDQVTKNAGGKLENVAKGQQEKALETAAFATKPGELAGPVKSESGYYVVRVDKVTAAKTIPFAQVKAVLKQQVQQTKPQEAFTKWQDRVVKEWKKKTECREGYNTAVFCKNQPKSATTTAAAGASGQ